ncbi:unnamed protein product [Discosporangium mesarthrocarpum]
MLYLFSPLVVEHPPFWPASVRVCGYIFPGGDGEAGSRTVGLTETKEERDERKALPVTGSHTEGGRQEGEKLASIAVNDGSIDGSRAGLEQGTPLQPLQPLQSQLDRFLSLGDNDKPIYVGFGSMWSMCPPGSNLALLLRTIVEGALQVNIRCLVVLPAGEPAKETCVGEDQVLQGGLQLHLPSTWYTVPQVHRGSLQHASVLPRCLAAVHHGGSGTTAAVLRAGIPHVVCPQHLDQFFWAERMAHLSLGTVLDRFLFVRCGSSTVSPDATLHTTPSPGLVARVGSALLRIITPQMRLRCACLGVKIRSEDSTTNVLRALEEVMSEPEVSFKEATHTASATLCSKSKTPDSEHKKPEAVVYVEESVLSPTAEGSNKQKGASQLGEELLGVMVMPNDISLWYIRGAVEETLFVYKEIFEANTYLRHGISLGEGDTLWDVGANIGLFTIMAELSVDSPDSIQVYAFEPLPAVHEALKRNLGRRDIFAFVVSANVMKYALGVHNADKKKMTFFPHMPGNSSFKPLEKAKLQGRMRRNVSASSAGQPASFFDGAQEVNCKVRTLSWALSDLKVPKIDLLKIDVEGEELDVLIGVNNEDWSKIRQVVAEVHPVGTRVEDVCQLLHKNGFTVLKEAFTLDGRLLERDSSSHDKGSGASTPDNGAAVEVVGEKDSTGNRDINDEDFVPGLVFMVYAKRLFC